MEIFYRLTLRAGLYCEGASMVEEEVPVLEGKAGVVAEVGKRARGEAMLNAWARVVLVIVEGKVGVGWCRTGAMWHQW